MHFYYGFIKVKLELRRLIYYKQYYELNQIVANTTEWQLKQVARIVYLGQFDEQVIIKLTHTMAEVYLVYQQLEKKNSYFSGFK